MLLQWAWIWGVKVRSDKIIIKVKLKIIFHVKTSILNNIWIEKLQIHKGIRGRNILHNNSIKCQLRSYRVDLIMNGLCKINSTLWNRVLKIGFFFPFPQLETDPNWWPGGHIYRLVANQMYSRTWECIAIKFGIQIKTITENHCRTFCYYSSNHANGWRSVRILNWGFRHRFIWSATSR